MANTRAPQLSSSEKPFFGGLDRFRLPSLAAGSKVVSGRVLTAAMAVMALTACDAVDMKNVPSAYIKVSPEQVEASKKIIGVEINSNSMSFLGTVAPHSKTVVSYQDQDGVSIGIPDQTIEADENGKLADVVFPEDVVPTDQVVVKYPHGLSYRYSIPSGNEPFPEIPKP